MSKVDSSSIISVLWLIAASLPANSGGFALACMGMFAAYSLKSLYEAVVESKKVKP